MTKYEIENSLLPRMTVHQGTLGKTEEAYRIISERIRSGDLLSGDYVNEYRLAGELGINRSALREALNQLMAEGLLEKRENRRVYVVELGQDQRSTLRRYRAVIESGAAYFAALHRRTEDLRVLEEFVEEHGFLVEREYWEGVAKADERFHHHIVLICGNPMILQAYEHSKIRLRISMGMDLAKNEYENTIPEHTAIIRAIEEKNPEAARNLTWKHLMKSDEETDTTAPAKSDTTEKKETTK